MAKAISRKPVLSRKPTRTPGAKKEAPRVRVDPLREYQEAIKEDGNARIVTLGGEDCSSSIKHWFSTGSLALDRLLNGRGFPAGRLSEVFGPSHIGKSTLLDHVMAECQRAGGIAVLADTESARDVTYTKRLGVDSERLQILEFDRGKLTIENVLDKIAFTADFWATKHPDVPVVIGFDVLGGTATSEELAKKLGADGAKVSDGVSTSGKQEHVKPGGAAKVMRQACRQLISKIANTKVAVIVCNHEYEKIQMGFSAGRMGKKRETYGGDAIRLAASYRIELFNLGQIKRGDEVLGNQVGARLVKNRLGKPWGTTEFAMISGLGIDNTWDVFEHLRGADVIKISGAWASINLDGEVLKFQGWSGLQSKIQENPSLFSKLVSVYQQVLRTEVPDASIQL